MSKPRPPGAWPGLLPHGSGSSEPSSLSQVALALLLGVAIEVFCLLPLSDGFLARAANAVSSLPPRLLPTSLLRMPCTASLVAAEFWGAGAVANTSVAVSWRSCFCRVIALRFGLLLIAFFFPSFSLEFWFYWVSLHVCCFKLISVPCWDIFKLYRNWLIWALEWCHWRNMCACFCVLINIERLVAINCCFFQ